MYTLQDTEFACEQWPGAELIPEHLIDCYKEQGRREEREKQGINWSELLAGAAVGLVATVIGHNIIKRIT